MASTTKGHSCSHFDLSHMQSTTLIFTLTLGRFYKAVSNNPSFLLLVHLYFEKWWVLGGGGWKHIFGLFLYQYKHVLSLWISESTDTDRIRTKDMALVQIFIFTPVKVKSWSQSAGSQFLWTTDELPTRRPRSLKLGTGSKCRCPDGIVIKFICLGKSENLKFNSKSK